MCNGKLVLAIMVAIDTMYLLDWMDVEASELPFKGSKIGVHDSVEQLLYLAAKGDIVIHISRRFLTDKIQDRNSQRRERDKQLLRVLSSRPGVMLKSSTLAFDIGWGRFASTEERCLERLLEFILYPEGIAVGEEGHWRNKVSDVHHLRDAIESRCSHFLSEEKRFHDHSCELLRRCGIRILRLADLLGKLEAYASGHQP